MPPPVLAGRDRELQAADEHLEWLRGGHTPSRDILFYGPRGNGKTSLLDAIGHRAQESGLRVEELPADALTDEDKLVRELQERAGVLRDRLTSLQLGVVGGAAERSAPTQNLAQLLAAWVAPDPAPLVVLLDEVQALVPEVARPFFDAVQQVRKSLPFLLVAAGTPDAPSRLREAASHNERGFQFLPVGRLAPGATRQALGEPARQSGLPMDGEALALLAGEAQDYPYFIQLLGRTAWDEADRTNDDGLDSDAARRGIRSAAPEIQRFYRLRFDEARSRGVHRALEPLAALLAARGGKVADRDLEELLERLANTEAARLDWFSLLAVLRDLGVLWETEDGVWELGIPSFGDYIRHRATR